MDISTNRISLTFDDTERMEKKNVSVQDAKDGGISQIQVGATMDILHLSLSGRSQGLRKNVMRSKRLSSVKCQNSVKKMRR